MVDVGEDYGGIFLGITALIGMGLIFFWIMPSESAIKDCEELMTSENCVELNQYLMRCPDLREHFVDQNCSLMNVTSYGVIIDD